MTQVAAPLGNTPQGQQLNTSQTMNTQAPPPGSPISSYPSDADLNSAYSTANQNYVTANSANTRQSLVDSSGIPGMQSSYDDLAQQLFNYDTGVLQPQFQGTNGGTPADAASFGRVAASPLAMTPGSLNNPVDSALSTFNSNPKYAYTSQADQANSILSILGNLNSRIGSTLGLAGTKSDSDVQAALSTLTGISDIMGKKADLVKAAATNATDLQKTLLGLGLATVDENGKIVGTGSGADSTKIDWSDRNAVQNYYKQFPINSTTSKNVAAVWKSANGSELFPSPVKGTDLTTVNETQRVLSLVQKAKDILAKDPNAVGGLNGIIADTIIGNSNNALGKAAYQALTPDQRNLNDIFTQMRSAAERKMVGGRLTGYLLSVLNPAFPGLYKSSDQINSELDSIIDTSTQDLQTIAGNHSYDDYTQLPGINKDLFKNTKSSTGSTSSGQTLMTGPDGKQYNVPNAKVNLFKQNGYK